VAIVFMSLVGTVFILHQIKGMRKVTEPSDSEQKLRQEVESLEQRVRTLERIATDSKTHLKEEIDTL